MNKKNITISIISILIISIIFCILFLFTDNKQTDFTTTYSSLNAKSNKKTYNAIISTENKELSETPKEEIEKQKTSYPSSENRQEALVPSSSPYHNTKDGWVANVLSVNDGSATVEVYNASNTDILIEEGFVAYLGVNADGSGVESKTTKGLGETIKPGESLKITVTNGGDAKFLKVGYTNAPKNWAMYYVKNFSDRVSNENQYMNDDDKDSDVFNITASITPKIFKSLNIGTSYSRKLTDTTVGELKLTKQEIKNNPYATLGYIEIDIFNKTNEKLLIDGLDILHKQNNKVVNTQSITYKESIQGQSLGLLKLPFKSMGGGIRTTLVLHTNINDITIHDPELLFSTIKQ